MEDRRVFARINTSFPVRFLDPTRGIEGRAETVDISANGLGLVTQENLSSRTPLEIWLDIPDQHEPLYTRGNVVWSQASSDAGQQRVGIRLEKAELMGLARVLWMRKQAEDRFN
ncbi:MAG: PilZ domain-containing protein [Candidatus Omnitrophica bacterium]|nr:PilZ domain-containing protein [Candidatus Omnitrophota bacterium]MDD5592079.1 PilZ domain-containing protein [Candidatus Omnitrophota bacterium]